MSLFKCETKEFILNLDNSLSVSSKIYIIELNNKRYVFLESSNKQNISEFSEEVYSKINKLIDIEEVYLDLSNIYGTYNNSWLTKWKFIINNNELIDEEFYRMEELDNLNKDEYIVVKNYIKNKHKRYKS